MRTVAQSALAVSGEKHGSLSFGGRVGVRTGVVLAPRMQRKLDRRGRQARLAFTHLRDADGGCRGPELTVLDGGGLDVFLPLAAQCERFDNGQRVRGASVF